MEFVLIAYDGEDDKALERRMAAREDHLCGAASLKEHGKMVSGGAMLDESGKMIGSVCFYNCESREELDQLLAKDPYVSGGVWKKIEIRNFRTAPMFN